MAIHAAWLKHERQSWEQSRMVATFSVAPWCRKGTKLAQLIRFPWDGEQETRSGKLNKKDRKARYKAALARYGLRAGSMAGTAAATTDVETAGESSPEEVEKQAVDKDADTEEDSPD